MGQGLEQSQNRVRGGHGGRPQHICAEQFDYVMETNISLSIYMYVCTYIYMVICCAVLVTLSGDLFSSLQCGHQGIYLGKSLCCFGIFNWCPVPGAWRWLGGAGSILALLLLRVSSEQVQTSSAWWVLLLRTSLAPV